MIRAGFFMHKVTTQKITNYRNQTFRLQPGLQLKTPQQAVDFVNERGFIFFWPVKGYTFPSLWGAVAGDRPVADEHDDPGHITWNWKDSLLDKKVWYYARVLKRKNTMISLEAARYFYALSPNFGEPEADFADQYNQGLLPLEAKLIFDALVRKGPLDTLSLRKEAHLTGSNSSSPFNRALDLLQQQFKLLPIAISEAGAWKYAFVYDLTHRHFPELPEQARFIPESRAMEQILIHFFSTIAVSNLKKITALFQWENDRTRNALGRMVKSGVLLDEIMVEGNSEPQYCLKSIIDSLT